MIFFKGFDTFSMQKIFYKKICLPTYRPSKYRRRKQNQDIFSFGRKSKVHPVYYCSFSSLIAIYNPRETTQDIFEPTRLRSAVVICLATDAKLTADPGVASLIPVRSHTFVEIDHEIISTVILLPSPESFWKGCCRQLQAKVCARSTG